jgi:mannan endo-1,4-beta-mannosidase
MRDLVSFLPLLAAASVGALPASGDTSGTAAASFAKPDGLFFNIDGETKYYAGTNCYWCGFLTSDEDVDKIFSDMAAADLKIIRVWGFNDANEIPGDGTVYYQYLSANGSEINTGSTGLERLDAVVSAAETHGLKLIINFVNNWVRSFWIQSSPLQEQLYPIFRLYNKDISGCRFRDKP